MNSSDDLTSIKGIGDVRAHQLAQMGIETFVALATADAEEVATALGAGEEQVAAWQEAALAADVGPTGPESDDPEATAARAPNPSVVDDLAIVDRALTADEVKYEYFLTGRRRVG